MGRLPEDVPLHVDVVLSEVNALLHVVGLWHGVDVDQVNLNTEYAELIHRDHRRRAKGV